MAALDDILGAQKRFGFTAKALPPGTMAVVELSGTEAISRPYAFDVTLASEDSNLAFEKVLDQPATLTVYPRTGDAPPVQYHGLVTHLEQAHQIGAHTVYRAVLMPRLWNLSRRRMSEVYVDQTIPHLLERKLHEHGFTSQDYELKLVGAYKSWPYVCQYRETDLDFIARLMERDGIYFFFEQGPEREKMVIVDAQAMHPASVRSVSYRPAAQLETGVSEESLQAWVCRQQSIPQTVVLQDYNYRTASLALAANGVISPSGQGEVRLYGEAFETLEEGQALAKVVAQALACRQRTFQGEGTVTGLRAGFFVAVQGHYRADVNARYLVTEVRHEGAQAGTLLAGLEVGGGAAGPAREDFYRSECSAIPASVQFRPERVTPKPVIQGTMTAFIDEEGTGEYAELDEHGRYKVQVPFDKTDKLAGKASAWLRLATPYAGQDHGLHFPLHKGTEVLLSFQDGDLNRPVIMAAVPNSTHPSQVTRTNQTQSVIHTAGNNHLIFEDQEGSEHIHLQTPKDQTTLRMGTGLSSTVGAQAAGASTDGFTFTTGANWTVSAQDASTTLENDTLTVSGTQTETISGDVTKTIGGDFNGKVTGTSKDVVLGAKYDIVAGLNHDIVAGVNYNIVGGDSADLVVGAKQSVVLGHSVEVHKGPVLKTSDAEMDLINDKIEASDRHIQTTGEYIQTLLHMHIVTALAECEIETRTTDVVTDVSTTGTAVHTAESVHHAAATLLSVESSVIMLGA